VTPPPGLIHLRAAACNPWKIDADASEKREASMKPVAHYKTILETRLAELEVRLHKLEDSLEQPRSKDFEDQATERENDEVKEELGHTGLDEIRAIRAALQRIEDGSYGICINTGERIPEARLDAVPYAATVVRPT